MKDNKYFREEKNIIQQVDIFGKLYLSDNKAIFDLQIINILKELPAAYIADKLLKDIDIPKISKDKKLFSILLLKLKLVLNQIEQNIHSIDVVEDRKNEFTFYFKFINNPRVQILCLKYPERYDNWKDIKYIY